MSIKKNSRNDKSDVDWMLVVYLFAFFITMFTVVKCGGAPLPIKEDVDKSTDLPWAEDLPAEPTPTPSIPYIPTPAVIPNQCLLTYKGICVCRRVGKSHIIKCVDKIMRWRIR